MLRKNLKIELITLLHFSRNLSTALCGTGSQGGGMVFLRNIG